MPLTWDDVAARKPIRLNLGGGPDCHPDPRYRDYISVDAVPRAEFGIGHDLTTPLPLPDGSVDRILTEHFLEHIPLAGIAHVLRECYRLLPPGHVARVGVPDYGHPRDRYCLKLGHDPRRHNHQTLTTFPLCAELVAASPFKVARFYQYWDGDRFVHHPVDFELGYLRRTPETDPRNQARGFGQQLGRFLRDVGTVMRKGPFARRIDFQTRKYHPLAITSVVFDLVR
jgi:predicted SAM-dependent methyltransferase